MLVKAAAIGSLVLASIVLGSLLASKVESTIDEKSVASILAKRQELLDNAGR